MKPADIDQLCSGQFKFFSGQFKFFSNTPIIYSINLKNFHNPEFFTEMFEQLRKLSEKIQKFLDRGGFIEVDFMHRIY